MFYVYILRSQTDKNLYVGYTSDLQKRIKEHNSGNNFSTKHRIPFEVIYYEAYKNKQDAQEREVYFKTGWGRKYVVKILKNYFRADKS